MTRATTTTNPFFERFSNAVNGADMRQDASSSSIFFTVGNGGTGDVVSVKEIIILGTGGAASRAAFLGTFGGATLTDGVSLLIVDGQPDIPASPGVIHDILAGETLGSLQDVFSLTTDIEIEDLGASTWLFTARITFAKSIELDDTRALAIKLDDDHTVGTASLGAIANGART